MPQPAPAVLQLIEWLQQHVPAQDAAPPAPALVHGDYRLDNLVFDQQLQVRAILRRAAWWLSRVPAGLMGV